MNSVLELPKGKYVVAVSGGVDSMVLLDLVRQQVEPKSIVAAHFVHGVRSKEESSRDVELIEQYCMEHAIDLQIGTYDATKTDEASLREARYAFLDDVRTSTGCDAVLTAHHEDDLVETAIINLLRGTKGAGLNSIQNQDNLLRPLLKVRKAEILDYANEHGLAWHEDATNHDTKYVRNYIRANITPVLEAKGGRQQLLELIEDQGKMQTELSAALKALELDSGDELARRDFILLPHAVACRVMHDYLVRMKIEEPSAERVNGLVIFAKTKAVGQSMNIARSKDLVISEDEIKVLKKD